jgi:hypothetical protein
MKIDAQADRKRLITAGLQLKSVIKLGRQRMERSSNNTCLLHSLVH